MNKPDFLQRLAKAETAIAVVTDLNSAAEELRHSLSIAEAQEGVQMAEGFVVQLGELEGLIRAISILTANR